MLNCSPCWILPPFHLCLLLSNFGSLHLINIHPLNVHRTYSTSFLTKPVMYLFHSFPTPPELTLRLGAIPVLALTWVILEKWWGHYLVTHLFPLLRVISNILMLHSLANNFPWLIFGSGNNDAKQVNGELIMDQYFEVTDEMSDWWWVHATTV